METVTREPLSKRTRFEVFKRDGFACVYCGSTPNDGPLHVDHVQPRDSGGTNDPGNLVTSCATCNLGKSSVPLTERRLPRIDPEAAEEHAEQIRAWLDAQQKVIRAKQAVTDSLINAWCDALGAERYPADLGSRLNKALAEWGMADLLEAFAIVGAAGHLRNPTQQLRYFYGILRNWREDAAAEAHDADLPTTEEWAALHKDSGDA